MTRYTPERGWGLDLSGPEPVWRGKRPGWSRNSAAESYSKNRKKHTHRIALDMHRENLPIWIPRYRIDDYIKRGLIDPARRDER
jgi:hypothetical protein